MALAPAHAEDRIGAEIAPRPVACAALSQATLPNASIELAEWHRPQVLAPDGTSAITGSTNKNSQVGALCLVRGVINARAGVSGKGYGIGFELRLPEAWNSKFLFQGGGGTDGFLARHWAVFPFRAPLRRLRSSVVMPWSVKTAATRLLTPVLHRTNRHALTMPTGQQARSRALQSN